MLRDGFCKHGLYSIGISNPVQVLLGGPFYRRFFVSLKKRSGFTVDTLVVLSTTVAYVYSIVAMFTNQDTGSLRPLPLC